MPDYDFSTLSPIDFEIISRDLLQNEYNITLESFKPGKDLGIDFRACTDENQLIVIQCKHYSETGFKGLFNTLKNKELPKIIKLKPNRYILTTSVALSPSQKNKLFKLLSPYVNNLSDILGKDDINNLLGKFPDIEKKHFKLWLSSVHILENIINANILKETELEIEDIHNKARLYVINDSFSEALNILKQHHYCIIAGIPGIGKTMLAKMIILHYIMDKYDFIAISKDISDVFSFSFSSKNTSRIFLYDDFLGKTALSEKLEKNEEQRLSKFVEHIGNSTNERLILTTREYILHQAQRVYEQLDNPLFNKPQCIIDLSKYTRDIRAKILYNHLYFSNIDRSLINEIIIDKTYLKIIDHDNFNPRIIEYMTNKNWLTCNTPIDYPKEFINNLKNPSLIWERVFTSQINKNSRDLLIILMTLSFEVFLDDLFKALCEYKKVVNEAFDEVDFHETLKELDGNFTKTTNSKKGIIISFHNPSILDFIKYYISDKPALVCSILASSVFYEQIEFVLSNENIHNLCIKNKSDFSKVIIDRILININSQPCSLSNWSEGKSNKTYKDRSWVSLGRRYSFLCKISKKSNYHYLVKFINSEISNIKLSIEKRRIDNYDLNNLLKELTSIDSIKEDDLNEIVFLTKESLFDKSYQIDNVDEIFTYFTNFPHMKKEEDISEIKNLVTSIIDNYSSDDKEWLNDELYTLERIAKKNNINFDYEISQIQNIIDEEDNYENDDPKWDYEDSGSDKYESQSDDDIANMFETLRI